MNFETKPFITNLRLYTTRILTMDTMKDLIFCEEIVLQIKIARKAFEELEVTHERIDPIHVWASIQSVLVSTANISKLLFPSDKKYKERGIRLRKLLNVSETSILNKRKFRNNFFEHYDARVEEWFIKNKTGVYIDLAMNPSLNGDHLNTHRGYNHFNKTIVFRGEAFDLHQMFAALDELYINCKPFTFT